MPTYRITHRVTRESYTVDAPFAQDATERLGWLIGDCHVARLPERPAPPQRPDPSAEYDLHVIPCQHGDRGRDISPYDGDVWCLCCDPARDLSDDYRRMTEALDNEQPPTEPLALEAPATLRALPDKKNKP